MPTDKEKIADEIMDTLIDERNLTANDLLNDDQAALLHVAIVTRLAAAESSDPKAIADRVDKVRQFAAISIFSIIFLASVVPSAAKEAWHECRCKNLVKEECGWTSKDLRPDGRLPKWCVQPRERKADRPIACSQGTDANGNAVANCVWLLKNGRYVPVKPE